MNPALAAAIEAMLVASNEGGLQTLSVPGDFAGICDDPSVNVDAADLAAALVGIGAFIRQGDVLHRSPFFAVVFATVVGT